MPVYLEVVVKLFLAVLLGGIVGYEREYKSMPAGLRTHILVCIGAALVQIISVNYLINNPGQSYDPMRLGAQVISGIGFLGAGTIIKDKNNVKGLTTAASLWVVACIGIAVGSGFYFEGILTTVIIFISLKSFKTIEENILRVRRNNDVRIKISNIPGKLGEIASALGALNINIENIDANDVEDRDIWVELNVKIPKNVSNELLIERILSIEGVKDIQFIKI